MPDAAIDPATLRRVLFVRLYALGDVILCTPVVRAVRRLAPQARIEFLTTSPCAAAVRGLPDVDDVLVTERRTRAVLAVLPEVRRRRYDLLIDLQGQNNRTALIAAFSAARRRIGERRPGPRDLAYTDLVPRVRSARTYIGARHYRFLAPLGVHPGPSPDVRLDVAVTDADRRWADATWHALGLGDDNARPVVALSPVSHEPNKQWGAARWAAVADALAADGVRVLLTHGPGQRAQVAAVAAAARAPLAWDYEPATVGGLAALYERCALWVGNDGGARHVAVAAGLPTVASIRCGVGAAWTPPGPHLSLDRAEPACGERPCSDCPRRRCVAPVSVERMVAAAREQLIHTGR